MFQVVLFEIDQGVGDHRQGPKLCCIPQLVMDAYLAQEVECITYMPPGEKEYHHIIDSKVPLKGDM